MDESGILMSPSQLSQFFENESFNLYAPNHGDDELSEWLLSQDIPVAPTSSVEHNQNQNQNPDLTTQIHNKPRGRPPGSKNKPKPPLFINQESEEEMKLVLIEVAAGFDVVEALVKYADLHNVGISVLSASGSVANVTLHHVIPRSPALTLHGPFTLLALIGTYISGPFYHFSSAPNSFGITLSGSQGEMFGGLVAGKVVAGSTVVVTLTVFKNPEFYKVGLGENGEGCVVADANVGAGAVAVAVAGHHNPITGGGGNYNVSALQNIPSLTFPQSY